MRKINILILVDKFTYHGSTLNGPTRYFTWLMQLLDRQRFTPHLVALRTSGSDTDVLESEGIFVTYLSKKKYNPFIFTSIVWFIKKFNIDVIHLSGYGACTLGRLAGLLTKRPCIVHEHWVDPNFGGIIAFLERCLGPLTHMGIAVSSFARDFLIEKKRLPSNRVQLVRNGIPINKFCLVNHNEGDRVRKELGLGRDNKIIGAIGMLHSVKGHRYLIEAASEIIKKCQNARFVIVGEGTERDALTEQISKLGLNDIVILTGQRADIPAVLSMFDIMVLPSITESAPLVLIEAMAAGKPIVAADCGGSAEYIKDGMNGLIVPIKNSNALAKAILKILNDPKIYYRLGKSAAEEAKKYNINKMIKEIEKVYFDVFDRYILYHKNINNGI